MQILHLVLKKIINNDVEIRYFYDNANDYKTNKFSLAEIKPLIDEANNYYYISPKSQEDLVEMGKKLYNFLNGKNNRLVEHLENLGNQQIILAIATEENLAHMPWEVLHDGKNFLLKNWIIPVRWLLSNSNKKTLSIESIKKERALQVLFMASSPIGVEPVLDYEAEEAHILEATKYREPKKSLSLMVEETGSLSGLKEVMEIYQVGTFDILHLTGHSKIKDKKPIFITETETGEAQNTSAEDIVKELRKVLPKLVFLSACHTGRGEDAYSMAEELLLKSKNVEAVLGWGNKVLDTDATQAAKVLYEELSKGFQVAEAVAKTYEILIESNARDWHLLRLYTKHTLPGELVTSYETKERKPAPIQLKKDKHNLVGFIGRRRQLKRCYKELTQEDKKWVLIHGMGGLGKATLARRLCEKFPNREVVETKGIVDEENLVKNLLKKDTIQKCKGLDEELKTQDKELLVRLRLVFQKLSEQSENYFLFVLNNFEENLDFDGDKHVVKPEAAKVLNAIAWAIRDTSSQIIITCRYDFEFDYDDDYKDELGNWRDYIYKQPLDALRGADLQKKWNRLTGLDVDKTFRSYVEKLADGNHRLLKLLYEGLGELQKPGIEKSSIFDDLKAKREELLPQVLEKRLCEQIESDQPMREILERGLVFDLPVPRQALEAVCETVNELDKCIDKAVALGLLEASYNRELLRVPRYLGLEKFDEISLNKKAAKELNRLWYEQAENREKVSEERLLEIHRLAMLGNEREIIVEMTKTLVERWKNQSRFQKIVELCTKTLESLKDDVAHHQVVKIWSSLADSNIFLGYLKKAESQYEEALKKGEQLSMEEKSLDFAQILDGSGYLYTLMKEYDKSNRVFDKALNIIYKNTQEKLFNQVQNWRREEKLPIKVQFLSHLAYWHREQKEWEKARFLYVKALWMCKRLSRKKSITLAEHYHNLATFYHEQGEKKYYEKAKAWYWKSLKLKQGFLEDEQNLTLAITCSSLAKIYFFQENEKKAKELFIKAQEIKHKQLGEHLSVVEDMKNVGITCYEIAKNEPEQYKEAKDWFCQALDMINFLVCQKHASLDNNLENLFEDLKSILHHLESIYNKSGQGDSNKATNLGCQKRKIEIAYRENKTIEALQDVLC